MKSKVTIPKALIQKLKPYGARFIKVASPTINEPKTGKQAVEHGWKDRPYEANDTELQSWLEHGGNYGVLCGEGLYEIDLDTLEMQKIFDEHVKTFTVKSGSGTGKHYFIRSNVEENGTILALEDLKKKRKNLGNVQVRNKYVVGAGSNHWMGNKYEIINDEPFAWVSKKELEKIFGELLVWSRQKLSEDEAKIELQKMKDYGFQIPILDVVDIEELKQISAYELQGEHPIHGSTTGINFCINTEKNCWHCFRCNSGGGALSWLAVKHGLIRCDEAQKGALKGSIFKQVLEAAKKEGFDIELKSEDTLNPDVQKYFERRNNRWTFVAAFLGEELVREFHYLTRERDTLIFRYHSDTGIYTPNGEAHIKRQTKKRLGKHYSRYRQSETLAYIEAATIQKVRDAPPYLLILKNGILNLETRKLEKFNPKYFILNALPVTYNPKAKCPIIMKFLSEVLHKEDIQIIQEISGYCLYREYLIHKAIMLIGEGANGKSTFMELLRTLLNNENVATEPLQGFESNRFAIVSLYGKLANIYPDLSDSSLKATGLFKMLTGGDTITAEYKYRDRFCFRNYAKLIFSANKIPESSDDTTAFFRRWIIINFPNQFLPNDPKTDPNLIKKLTTKEELSGFLNWILDGLERLLKNGKFSYNKTVEDTRDQYIRSSNPVQAFIKDKITFDSEKFVPKQKVFQAFLDYCKQMKLPTVSITTFKRKLIEHAPSIQTVRRDIKARRTRCWLGIAMRDNTENAQNAQQKALFATVSLESEKKSIVSKSKKNSVLLGVSGVEVK